MATRNETYDGQGNLLSVVDDRDLQTVKEKKWEEVNVFREVVLNRGLWFMGYCWGTDERSRANITGMTAGIATGIPLPSNFTWRDNNNNNVPFDLTKTVTLAAYILSYVNQVYTASWNMKALVDNCQTLAEIDAFSVPLQQWPDGNMDGTKPDE